MTESYSNILMDFGLNTQLGEIPIKISAFTLLLLVFFIIDGRDYLQKNYATGFGTYRYWTYAALGSLGILLSLAFHELSHGLVAYAFSQPITEAGVSWWGAYVKTSETILIEHPGIEILIVGVGPLSNFIVAGVCTLIVKWFGESLTENTVQYVGCINFRIGMFNALPLFITDGNKVVMSFFNALFGLEAAVIISLAISAATIAYLVFRPERHWRPTKKFECWLTTL